MRRFNRAGGFLHTFESHICDFPHSAPILSPKVHLNWSQWISLMFRTQSTPTSTRSLSVKRGSRRRPLLQPQVHWSSMAPIVSCTFRPTAKTKSQQLTPWKKARKSTPRPDRGLTQSKSPCSNNSFNIITNRTAASSSN